MWLGHGTVAMDKNVMQMWIGTHGLLFVKISISEYLSTVHCGIRQKNKALILTGSPPHAHILDSDEHNESLLSAIF